MEGLKSSIFSEAAAREAAARSEVEQSQTKTEMTLPRNLCIMLSRGESRSKNEKQMLEFKDDSTAASLR